MIDESQPNLNTTSSTTVPLTEQEKKYGKSIFKKWIYAKFDAKLILEVVEKDIYLNPKLAILLPTLNANGKKTFLSATLDLKGLQSLQTEITNAIAIMQEHQKASAKNSKDQVQKQGSV